MERVHHVPLKAARKNSPTCLAQALGVAPVLQTESDQPARIPRWLIFWMANQLLVVVALRRLGRLGLPPELPLRLARIERTVLPVLSRAARIVQIVNRHG